MSMSHQFYYYVLLLFTLLLVSFNLSNAVTVAKPRSLIMPVRKDGAWNQYYTEIFMGTPTSVIYATLDLSAELTWFECEVNYTSSTYKPVQCGSKICTDFDRAHPCVGCYQPYRPGCSNNTCGTFPYNPFAERLASEGLGQDVAKVPETDGRVYLKSSSVAPHFQFSCVGWDQLAGLADGTRGMVGLARTRTSLPQQLSAAHKLPRKFALCIPSSTKHTDFGSVLIGGGPYFLTP